MEEENQEKREEKTARLNLSGTDFQQESNQIED
jgi:hypothetical protein